VNQPDANTLLMMIAGFAGWAWSAFRRWQMSQLLKGFKAWQHKAMWQEYAEKHDIPVNGKD
jgi:hypothetical protein